MMEEKILYGNRIFSNVPVDRSNARFGLIGTNDLNEPAAWPISEDTLSKHILLLGAIGTGKTNAMNCLLGNLRMNMTRQDVMFLFDTKGDYYKEFYRQPMGIIQITGICSAKSPLTTIGMKTRPKSQKPYFAIA